jgi:hypothetical protein
MKIYGNDRRKKLLQMLLFKSFCPTLACTTPSVTRALRHNTCQAQEPVSTRNATKRVLEILDAKYDRANLPAIVKDNCAHLTPLHREKLLSLLLEFEWLFDGTLGDWNRPPVSIELIKGATPYHGRPNPIPQIHKATLMKEIDRLVGIGVMKRQSSSQWASPTFIIPKKDMTVHFFGIMAGGEVLRHH